MRPAADHLPYAGPPVEVGAHGGEPRQAPAAARAVARAALTAVARVRGRARALLDGRSAVRGPGTGWDLHEYATSG